MWAKDDYQEHMLGYLDGVRIEFERLVHFNFQQQNLNAFYTELDVASEHLWRLIRANDADWEGFRYPLEASCDELLRTFYDVPCSETSLHPTSRIRWNFSRQRAERLLT